MKKTSSLALHRQTLRVLRDSHLRRVGAGGPDPGDGASAEPTSSNNALSVCGDFGLTGSCSMNADM